MSNNTTTTTELARAYRHLYRTALQAVHYSTPARHQIRSIIRTAFRTEPRPNFHPRRVENTLHFLRRAGQHNGVEHKILRNILHSRYWARVGGLAQRPPNWMRENDTVSAALRNSAYSPLHATVVMLNESMDLCLRS